MESGKWRGCREVSHPSSCLQAQPQQMASCGLRIQAEGPSARTRTHQLLFAKPQQQQPALLDAGWTQRPGSEDLQEPAPSPVEGGPWEWPELAHPGSWRYLREVPVEPARGGRTGLHVLKPIKRIGKEDNKQLPKRGWGMVLIAMES